MSLNRLLTRAAQNQDEPEDIVDFVRQRLDFYPDEKQILVLRGGARGAPDGGTRWVPPALTGGRWHPGGHCRPDAAFDYSSGCPTRAAGRPTSGVSFE